MMLRFLLVLLLAGVAPAQWRLSLITGGGERVVGDTCDLGSTSVGLEISAMFRLRNLGSAPAAVDSLAVRGADFTLENSAPVTIDSGGLMDFRVRFRPRSAGAFSAALEGPHGSTIVRASAVAAPIVRGPSGLPLGGDAGLEWSAVVIGAAETRRIVIENVTATTLPGPAFAVSGSDFAVSGEMPAELGPAQSVPLQVVFTPSAAGERTGELAVGDTRIRLRGYGVEPPPPEVRVLTDSIVRSAEQHVIQIRLDAPARRILQGEIAMQSAASDATLLFATGTRSVSFEFQPGQQERTVAYQTGTTAGVIGFRVQLGDQTVELSVQVLEEPIRVAAATAVREANSVVVRVTAIDNTLSASLVSCVFFDGEGRELGRWSHDYAEMFARYFSTSTLGGAYSLSMRFPVTGDVMGIRAVTVELTNRLGVTRTDRVSF